MLKFGILFMVFILPFITGCPSIEKLRPCKCTKNIVMQEEIICPGLENEQTLIDVMHALKAITKNFHSFTIEGGNFNFLPHDIFKGTNFLELKIMSSSFISLTDTDFAFEGLEIGLKLLHITNSTIMNTWDWTVLKNLENLKELSIEVGLSSISEDIKMMKSIYLTDISFANNAITHVHDTAFSAFLLVMSISLKNNAISEMKRSMIADPANMLWELDLSHNEIRQLPPDMFSNMPSLSILNLESNQLLMIHENTFGEVWAGLSSFDASNNHLRCDCKIAWITKVKKPGSLTGVCDWPLHMKGKSLNDIITKNNIVDRC